MLSSVGRTAVRRLTLRPVTVPSVVSRLVSRTAIEKSSLGWLASSFTKSCALRSFATDAGTTTTAKTTTIKKKATAKPSANSKKAAPKKAAPKPKKKKVVKKIVAKKPARKPKKELTTEQKEKLELRLLKKKSLYSEEPKKVAADQPWLLFTSSHLKGIHIDRVAQPDIMGTRFKDLGVKYRSLPSSELEDLKSRADRNKLENAAIHKAWIERHTVDDIRVANNARFTLKRKFNFPKTNIAYKIIKDDRLPRQPMQAWTYYVKARHASGDFNNQVVTDSIKVMATEWKSLSAAEKEPYMELAKGEQHRYQREMEALRSP